MLDFKCDPLVNLEKTGITTFGNQVVSKNVKKNFDMYRKMYGRSRLVL